MVPLPVRRHHRAPQGQVVLSPMPDQHAPQQEPQELNCHITSINIIVMYLNFDDLQISSQGADQ